jgi:DNA-binding NtrC family response regulator
VPVPQPRDGTLVLLDVERLDREQQAQLDRWLERFDERGRVQVVSAGSAPLFSLVETGAFLPDLYYRLNVVRMDLLPSEG